MKPAMENNLYKLDSLASVKLVNYQPNNLKYINLLIQMMGLLFFSQIFYLFGWEAYS